jgi:hypothetical protein
MRFSRAAAAAAGVESGAGIGEGVGDSLGLIRPRARARFIKSGFVLGARVDS